MKRASCLAAALVLASACRTPEESPDGSALLEAGFERLYACPGDRKITDGGAGRLDFSSEQLSLPNAYWMAVLATDAYSKKEVVVPELLRMGFDDALFFDEDGVARNFLHTGLDFPWASTQGFWAETPEGVVVSFRGSMPNEIADVISDVWLTQGKLEGIGAQAIGTITDAVAAATIELPKGAVNPTKADSEILVHRGFWNALQIVWKHLDGRAQALYASERPKERASKMAQLDAWTALWKSKGDEAALAELGKDATWRIEPANKLKFVKQWAQQTSEAKRRDLFEFLDGHWISRQKPIFLTGHSLGGGLATLAAYRLMKMGLNVRGLYTYGAPRVGNQAFVHDFRVLAFQRGLKGKGTTKTFGNGGLQRFVNHNDVVARIPPTFGWTGGLTPSEIAESSSYWAHASTMNYLTSDETPAPELWLEGDGAFDARFAQANVPRFVATLPLERWKQWGSDHSTQQYVGKLEKLAFGTTTACPE